MEKPLGRLSMGSFTVPAGIQSVFIFTDAGMLNGRFLFCESVNYNNQNQIFCDSSQNAANNG